MGTIYKNRGAIWNTVRLNVGVKNQIIILDNNQLTNVSIGMNRQNILGLNTVPSQGSKAGTQFPDLKTSPSWTVCATCCTYRVVLSISLKVWNRKSNSWDEGFNQAPFFVWGWAVGVASNAGFLWQKKIV